MLRLSNGRLTRCGAIALLAFVCTFAIAGLIPPPDSDGDDIPDSADNCLNVPNRLQTDTDVDGFGNLCDADFDNDGQINFSDLGQLRENFFSSSALHDLTGDGVVNAQDLGVIRQAFFGEPGPSGKITACAGSQCDNLPTLCEEGTEAPPLIIAWAQLPEPDSLASVPVGALLPLTITSAMQTTAFVEVEVAVALDAVRRSVNLGSVPVPPFGSITVQLNPAAFNLDFSGLDFSGRLVARATVRSTDGVVQHMAYTPHSFGHVEDGNMKFYRERLMLAEFNAGDYNKIISEAREWASRRGIKLVGVGHAGRLVLDEDDGGPRQTRE